MKCCLSEGTKFMYKLDVNIWKKEVLRIIVAADYCIYGPRIYLYPLTLWESESA
jgi:hypothetical protein